MATTFFAIAFLIAMFSLYPWRWLVADRFGSRKTLMLANFIMLLGVIPFGLAQSIPLTYLAAAIVGIGLGGLVLIGDVIVAEVVDEDEYKMGQQCAGMYFGMSSFIITLSG